MSVGASQSLMATYLVIVVLGVAGWFLLPDARSWVALIGAGLGFGLAGETLAFDYSLRTMGELGVTHQLGLSFKWDRPAPKPEIVRETPFMRAPARRPAAR